MIIEILDHKKHEVAKEIREVFQASYKVEADILNAADFPPLQRPLDDYIESANVFYAIKVDDEIAGITEMDSLENSVHIQSLVVKPIYFRQGIGSQLLEFTTNQYGEQPVTVETGLANLPAIDLYKKFHFQEVGQYNTEVGIHKIKIKRVMV